MSSESKKLRVLYFCSKLPVPVRNGIDLRVKGQISVLLEFSEVSVFALFGNQERFDPRISSWRSSKDDTVSRSPDSKALIRSISKGHHPFEARYSTETWLELRNEIRRFRPDYIVVSRNELSAYLEDILTYFDSNLIWDLDESAASMCSTIPQLFTSRHQAVVFKAFWNRVLEIERALIGRVSQVWMSSSIEREKVLSQSAGEVHLPRKISVVPHAVAVESYFPISGTKREKERIVYPASFVHEPALDAARFLINELMPLIPEVHLTIVGSFIPRWLRESTSEHISVVGPVASINDYLHKAGALAVPLRAGGGTRLKVIEALAAGLPIVSTAFGVEGLGLLPNQDYLEAESAPDFAEKCRQLFSNDELSAQLSGRGQDTASRRFSTRELEMTIRQLLSVRQ